ncbi:hypothetical protein M885DRAFT_310779 [Pelagophyceae sp. CCMP2097]|nr:hypothetical protein M885DRAFT_310779 [Pelagophyceae sp. CCMP2097]
MMMALAALVCLAARAAADAPKGPTLRVRLGSGALRRVALDAGASVRDVRARTNCEALFGDAACAGEALSDDADVADLGLNGATLYAPLTKKAPEAARAFRPYPNRLAPSGKRGAQRSSL